MNILFDISVLGIGAYNLRGKTGIARAIENTAHALHQLRPGEIHFCAPTCAPHLARTLKSLRTSQSDLLTTFTRPETRAARVALDALLTIYPLPGASRSIRQRAIDYGLHLAGRFMTSPDSDHLQDADIFHSTLHAFPKRLGRFPHLARFITIYDLIPVLYPQYFSNDPNHFIRQVIQGIQPTDWVIAISENTKADLCEYAKLDPNRVFVTPLAASQLFYPCSDQRKQQQARQKYGIPEGPYVLSLSTLEPRKNIQQTIRSFVALVKDQGDTNLNLVLVGPHGWDYEPILAEIRGAKDLQNRIVVTGFVEDEDLAAVYSGALMFVYPSFYEGFGLPPLEAMQCGVPVITSNTSSLPEVVGDAGFMVNPTDQDELTQAMLSLYRSSEKRNAFRIQGLERARSFTWKACAQATIAAYEVALG